MTMLLSCLACEHVSVQVWDSVHGVAQISPSAKAPPRSSDGGSPSSPRKFAALPLVTRLMTTAAVNS